MNQLDQTMQVMELLHQKFPKLKPRRIIDISCEIVELLNKPRTKVTEKDTRPFDNGGRNG